MSTFNAGDRTSGHILRVEVENFKSWKGKNLIFFSSQFTAIVGSNGSGKSNVMDSILFVTGVKAKKLRGEKLNELIFNADKKASEENRRMKVSLVYQTGFNELANYKEGEEVTFSRSVVHDTEGSSFEINHKKCSLQDYESTLRQLNILVQARNFLIPQGDVEAIASKTPSELTEFFEQISGSLELRKEYGEKEEAKKKTEEEALDMIKKVKVAKLEKKQAKEQKNDLERHKELCEELLDVKIQLALFKLTQCEDEFNKTKVSLKKAQAMVDESNEEEGSMNESLKQAKSDLAAKQREVSKQEKQVDALSREFKTLQSSYEKQDELLRHEKSSRKEEESRLKSAREQMKNGKKEKDECEARLEELKSREEELKALIVKEENAMRENEEEEEDDELTTEEKEAQELLRTKAAVANTERKQRLTKIQREIEVKEGSLAIAKANFEQFEIRQEKETKEREDLGKKKQQMDLKLSQQQLRLQEQIVQKKNMQDQITKLVGDIQLKQTELDQAKNILNLSKARTAESKRTKKLQECVDALKRHFDGVRGRLVDLVRPTNRKYGLAIDTALGKHLDSIVVDNEKVAFECLNYLRQQRLGTATFLPLDTIRSKGVSEDKRRLVQQHGNLYRLCIDLIEPTDPVIMPAVRFAAGDAMVCENLDDARVLCFQKNVRVKAVTVDGHLISPRGEMTGGAMGSEGRVDRFAESALQSAKETKDALETEIAEMIRQKEALESKVSIEAEQEMTASATRLQVAKNFNDTNATKLEELDKRLSKTTEAWKESEAKKKELETELNLLREEADTIKQQITEAEEAIGVAPHQKTVSAALQKARADLLEVQQQKAKLESHLRFLDTKDRSKALAESESKVKELDETIGELEAKVHELKSKVEEKEQALRQLQITLNRLGNAADVAQTQVKEAQKRLGEAAKEKASNLKQVTLLQGETKKLQMRQVEIIKQATLDGLDLPFAGGGDTSLLSSSSSSQNEKEEKDEESDFKNKKVDLTKYKKLYDNENEYANQMKQLATEIEALSPNTKADVRFLEADGKLKDVDSILKDVNDKRDLANEQFENCKARRVELFMNMFNQVASQIEQVYKQLTKTEDAPEGGAATLALEDQDLPFTSGIKFECFPPGKRYRELSQLSGGEKTVAALSLLFAIHLFRPSPFFILDEVDAALDKKNIKLVSDYMRAKANEGKFQCIVISLNSDFYGKADSLVGVYREMKEGSSGVLTLNLANYAL